ncbi:MAG: 2-amino-4-hydroxy-6-hydroxymethyldihydropteridine diphosphokinase [Thermocrispum agreste]|uniref:2-amino-4-hydroxy-6-hydroxymethyldihydropteridine diphosphokinase n=1 Tax=Thermocrispum agreste TaxID=37925 RepID=A0A2W4LLA2_9PSEU|nr:MAG: 2-amino-4-hydroxy-6-hydroxymethyldihydropteridine diphosphokinase [Thermocrispum agreste]
MSDAVLSLGSNLGDRLAYLQLAVDGLGRRVRAVSPVYETEPWGVTDQPLFLNAVVLAADDDLDHWGWLRLAQDLERKADRVREIRWGPRTLDVDVVTVDQVRSDDPRLLLPHPGTPDRSSVLIPWLAVDPDAELPGHGRVDALLAARPAQERAGVVRRDDLVLRVA